MKISEHEANKYYRMIQLVSLIVVQCHFCAFVNTKSADEPDEDNMEEIDLDNIIPDGRRTRGRNIDFAKAAEELPEEDDDEEDDDDFEAPNEDDEMKE